MPSTIFAKKPKKGQTGLNILLSVVTFLFIIGLIVAIFAIIGVQVYDSDASLATGVAGSVTQSNVNFSDLGFTPTGLSGLRDVAYVTTEFNITLNGSWLDSGNYSLASEVITPVGDYNNSLINITANYTHTTDTAQSVIINDTTLALSNTTDFFGIIVVITIMVVLILLTVLIILAVRNSGLITA